VEVASARSIEALVADALHDRGPMRMLLAVVLVATGCAMDTDPERQTDLAGLGPVSLDMWIGSETLSIDVRYDAPPGEPCPVLGDDFGGRIGGMLLSTFPGGMTEVCHAPTTGQPCIPAAPRCAPPYLGLSDLPRITSAVLVLGDASRRIDCKLGDALATRSMTRVPAGAWDVVRGQTMTVRWSPGSDLARFAIEVAFVERQRPMPPVAHVIDGDLVTFEVPADLELGHQAIAIWAHADIETTTMSCDVPTHRSLSYVVEQWVRVTE
jgi:hypothetical protein